MSASEALEHPWLVNVEDTGGYPLHPNVMYNLREVGHSHRLHFEMIQLLIPFIDDIDMKNIRETFLAIDTDNSGIIETDELKEAFQALNDQIKLSQSREVENKV